MLPYSTMARLRNELSPGEPRLSDLLTDLEAAGMSLWRLSRETTGYVASARAYAERGVRWQRARGRTPEEAVSLLLERLDVAGHDPAPASAGIDARRTRRGGS